MLIDVDQARIFQPRLRLISMVGLSLVSLQAADIDPAKPAAARQNGYRSLVTADRLSTPVLAPASKEGEARLKQFKLIPGLKVNLWAAEPMLANPVAFSVDEQGRIFTRAVSRPASWLEMARCG